MLKTMQMPRIWSNKLSRTLQKSLIYFYYFLSSISPLIFIIIIHVCCFIQAQFSLLLSFHSSAIVAIVFDDSLWSPRFESWHIHHICWTSQQQTLGSFCHCLQEIFLSDMESGICENFLKVGRKMGYLHFFRQLVLRERVKCIVQVNKQTFVDMSFFSSVKFGVVNSNTGWPKRSATQKFNFFQFLRIYFKTWYN